MKKMIMPFCACLIFLTTITAQEQVKTVDNKGYKEVKSFSIIVSFNKTTHILFPQPIKYVDLGSPGIMADKADVIDNVLRIKAAKEDFKETSLTVITADGSYYSFVVNFSYNPPVLNYSFSTTGTTMAPSASVVTEHVKAGNVDNINFADVDMSEGEMAQYCDWMIDHRRTVKHIGAIAFDFNFSLKGIYVKSNSIFLDVNIENNSNIDYDIDFIKFYVKDKEISKRTPLQSLEIKPLFNYPVGDDKVKGQTKMQKAFVFQKFTIPDDKVLVAEIYEKNGGRHLEFIIENTDIIRAKVPEKMLTVNIHTFKNFNQ